MDPAEARRAAEIAYSHSARLAEQYDVTTSPIIHNTLVNSGVKERGICVHYAEDMQARLNQENFRTLIDAARHCRAEEASSASITPLR